MLDAKLLPTTDQDPITLYGTWIPRRGDNLRLTVEVVANMDANLEATIFQKNYDEPGDGATTGVSVSFLLTTGRQTMEVLGLKELIRLQFVLYPDEQFPHVGKLLYRVLQPVWFETVKV